MSGGARYIPYGTNDQRVDDATKVSHIIATNIDFPEYHAAVEHGVHVVKPSWVWQSVNKSKLAGPRQHSPDPNQFFQEVVVSCGDLPEGDKDAIVAGVIALGGQYSGPLTKFVTHIVTWQTDNDKCALAKQKKVHCKIVLPHWFDDCLKLGKKINEKPYTFPNPQYLQSGGPRPVPADSPHVAGATGATPEGVPKLPQLDTPPASPSDARKNLNAFMGKKVKMSEDLGLGKHLLDTLEDLVNHGGGTFTDNVEEADIYIGQYRDGADYIWASRARKEVANLLWLYHVINQNKYTNPLSKLLHYPIPRDGIPGFEHMRISISNYNGDARVYLENLIRICGAEFTKTMKQDNSHLITAHTRSEKCEAAQEWNINLANHIWIEECYSKCKPMSLTNPRYTTFPERTNLGEVCGQTTLDMKRVEQVYFAKHQESPQKPAQPAATQAKVKPSPRKTVPASSAVPPGGTPKGTAQITAPTPIAEDAETEDEQTTEPQTAKKAKGRPRKSVTATPRHLDDEKENESPLPSTGRAAKQKALRASVGQGEDALLYEKEKKRKGGVTHGGRQSSHLEDLSSPAPPPKRVGKRKSDEATYDVTAMGSDLSDGETQDKPAKATKKAKHSAGPGDLPPVEYKMMVTGDERWIGKTKQEDADKTKLRMLGVQLTQDAKDVDILVAPKILRTRKFVAALASAPLVVDSKYLDTALKQNKLRDEPRLLQDRETEGRFGFKLAEALERAKVNDRKLLRGWSIFVTKDVPGGFETYKEIITLNGGDAFLYAGRTGLTMHKRRRDDPDAGAEAQNQGGDEELDFVYLVSGLSDPEVKLWKMFRSMAEKQDRQTRIVRNDWLLNAAMSQQVKWDEKWALDEATVLSQRNG